MSIVIATYNRPDALRAAIQSVYAQQYLDWRLIIVGDACDARTAAVVAEFDARTRYINLPTSCGEQAIPNSVGMSLGDSPVIALLNHDDLWLPDHLSLAIAALNQGAELFHGRSSVARAVETLSNGEIAPIFAHLSPIDANYGDVMSGCDFEPASAMVFTRALFDKLGRWRAAREIYRYPFHDWILRIWRNGAKVVFGTEVSVLKLETYWQTRAQSVPDQNAAGLYAQACPEHAYVLRQMAQLGQNFRAALLQQISAAPSQAEPKTPWLHRVYNGLAKQLFWYTTADLPILRARIMSGVQRGDYLKHMSVKRTGRELPPLPNFNALLQFAQRQIQAADSARTHIDSINLEQAHTHAN